MIVPLLLAGFTFIAYLKSPLAPLFNQPLDYGKHWGNHPIFGAHKTWRGFLIMPLATCMWGTLVTLFVSAQTYEFSLSWKYILVGLSYALGELPNSFLKRRLGILPGKKTTKYLYVFAILDTFDGLIAAGFVYYIVFHFDVYTVGIAILLGGVLHLLTDAAMIRLQLKHT